jgi:site-specific DNA recombinase
MTNKKAVIYCRVSTKEQVDDGNSLVTQEKMCREYALANGYEIAETFIEQGESAKTIHRTQLKKLLAYCDDRKHGINSVIVYKIDRLSRNTDDYGQIRLVLKRKDIDIKSTSELFEDTPAGRFMENIIANVAQFDNDVRTERSIGGSKEAMREGRYVWKAPYGYENKRIAGKSTIIPNDKAFLVTEAFQEVAKKYITVSAIHKYLVGKGLTTKNGRPLSLSQFYVLLRNEVYAGWIIKFKERHKGIYVPLVSEEVFAQVQRVLKKKNESAKQYQTNNPDFPLRKFMKNSLGKPITGCWARGHGGKYPYYLFRQKGGNYKRKYVEDCFIEFLNSFQFSQQRITTLKKSLLKTFDSKVRHRIAQLEVNELKIAEIKSKQSFLILKSMEGVIHDSLLKEQLGELDQEITNLMADKISRTSNNNFDFELLLQDALKFLKTPGNTWQNAPFEKKLNLQRFYFPNGVIFDGEKCRTSEMCSLFKVKDQIQMPNSCSVPSGFKMSNPLETVTFPSHFKYKDYFDDPLWNSIANELVHLSEFSKN